MTEKEHKGNTRGTKLDVDILTEDEFERLVAACDRRTVAGVRNRAVLYMLCRGMCRISETLTMQVKDLDLPGGKAIVQKGKGGKRRTIGLAPIVVEKLEDWLEIRKGLLSDVKGDPGWVFCRTSSRAYGNQLDSSYFRKLLPRLAKKAGINKRVHPHGLRHSGATRMLKSKEHDLGVISKSLGHSSISTTHRYVDHILPEDVIDAMQK